EGDENKNYCGNGERYDGNEHHWSELDREVSDKPWSREHAGNPAEREHIGSNLRPIHKSRAHQEVAEHQDKKRHLEDMRVGQIYKRTESVHSCHNCRRRGIRVLAPIYTIG